MYTNLFTILTMLAGVVSALPADSDNTKQLYRRDPSDQSGNSRFIYQVCELIYRKVALVQPFLKHCANIGVEVRGDYHPQPRRWRRCWRRRLWVLL